MLFLTTQQEKDLALKLLQFGTTLEQLALDGYPHILCNYLYELASSFMTFYEHCPILRQDVLEDTRSSRLAIAQLTARVMAKGLDLLGIEVMEQM